MSFLRRLFGGGSSGGSRGFGGSADEGHFMTFYVRPKHCQEIVEVRLNLMNDLSLNDDGEGYMVRKVARATRCPFPAELHVSFDKNRRVIQVGVQDGATVEAADYQAWLASK